MRLLKKVLDKITDGDVLAHELFYKTEFYKHKVRTMDFGKPYLNKIFQIVLLTKIETTVCRTKFFVIQFEYKKLSGEELFMRFVAEIESIIKEYNTGIRNQLIAEYDDAGIAIYEFIMNGQNGFNKFHERNVEHILHLIDAITHSKVFDNNNERMMLYLSEIQNALKTAVFDAEKQYKYLNGNLLKLLPNEC